MVNLTSLLWSALAGTGVATQWGHIKDRFTDWLDTLTGKTEKDHYTKADEIAEQSQAFNETYSTRVQDENERAAKEQERLAQVNLDETIKNSDRNYQLALQAYNDQKAENELTRQREDTAMQRQVADLKAAGLSPLSVSGGSAAGSVQVGPVPQYDTQAVTAARGSMIQVAQEYATLRNMAAGQYLTRKQAAENERIGAAMALGQMYQSRRLNMQNLALNTANLGMELNSLHKKNALIDEQIKSSQDTRNWMNEHGYRNQNLLSALIPVISRVAEHYGITTERILNTLDNLPKTIQTSLDNAINKTGAGIRKELKNPDLVENFSNKDLEETMFNLAIAQNAKLTDKELHTLADYYYPKMTRKSPGIESADDLYNWFKRDSFADVMNIAFGLSL